MRDLHVSYTLGSAGENLMKNCTVRALPLWSPTRVLDTPMDLHALDKIVVYYESIKREVKTEPIYECRCDERLKSRVEESILNGIH